MAIHLRDLRSAETRKSRTKTAKSLTEAMSVGKQTAFLSHSHNDNKYAEGLQVYLNEWGWDVYIDWQDNDMPSQPDRRTAGRVKEKIEQTSWFIFLATPNSIRSRWCPWEIGYADRAKDIERLIVIPTEDNSGNFYGNEYLQLYRSIENTKVGDVRLFEEGATYGGVPLKDIRI